MINIVIIGTNGSGKTVFLSALWKKYRNPAGRYWFNPQTSQTLDYLQAVWELLNNQQWPAGTAPGQNIELQLELTQGQKPLANLRILDIAGQDYREVFGGEVQMPTYLQQLDEYCREAEIVIALVNANEDLDLPEAARQDQVFYFSALQAVRQGNGPQAIVLTQCDQNAQAQADPRKFLQKKYPDIYNKYLFLKNIPVLAIAAVPDLRENGVSIPQVPIQSAGLDVFLEMLIQEVRALENQEGRQKRHTKQKKLLSGCLKYWKATILILVMIIALLIGMLFLPNIQKKIKNIRCDMFTSTIQKCDAKIQTLDVLEGQLQAEVDELQQKIVLAEQKLTHFPQIEYIDIDPIPSCVLADAWYAKLFGFCKEHQIVVEATLKNVGKSGNVSGTCKILCKGEIRGEKKVFAHFSEGETRKLPIKISNPDYCYKSHSGDLTAVLSLEPTQMEEKEQHMTEWQKLKDRQKKVSRSLKSTRDSRQKLLQKKENSLKKRDSLRKEVACRTVQISYFGYSS